MTARILCVDDDPSVLAGLQRLFRKRFALDVARSGIDGLAALQADGPYAVVVSDMHMPGMNGIEFLTRVHDEAPESVRIMLTGAQDLQTAKAAVNEGRIFRFLSKPVDPDTMTEVLTAALEHHRLVVAERTLLEDTLRGCVKVLTEVLSLAHPEAFSCGVRIVSCVRHMAKRLHLAQPWRFEVAAMLSQLGAVTLMPDTLKAVNAGQELTATEAHLYTHHPAVARDLLGKIPRLEAIAEMIGRQHEHTPVEADVPPSARDAVTIGAQLLQVALTYDGLVRGGRTREVAVGLLKRRKPPLDPLLLAALEDFRPDEATQVVQTVNTAKLVAGMVLDEDLRTRQGLLLVTQGQEITVAMLARLKNFRDKGAIVDRVRVVTSKETPPSQEQRVQDLERLPCLDQLTP